MWQLSTGPLLSLFVVVQQDMPCGVMSLHAPLCGKAASALIKAPCLMSTFQCWNGFCSNRRLAQQTDKNSISVLLRQLAFPPAVEWFHQRVEWFHQWLSGAASMNASAWLVSHEALSVIRCCPFAKV